MFFRLKVWRGERLSFLLQLQGLSFPYSSSLKHKKVSEERKNWKTQQLWVMTSEWPRDIGWCWVIQVYCTLPKKKQMWLQLCQLPQLRRKMSLLLTLSACSRQRRCFIFLLSLFSSHLYSGKCLHLSCGWITFWLEVGSVYIYISALKSQLLIVEAGQAISDLFLWKSIWVFSMQAAEF